MTTPTEWSWTRLSDQEFFELGSGLWKGKAAPFTEATVIRNTNFAKFGDLDLSDVARLQVETRQLHSRMLRSGDIIVERSGGGPKQPVGRVCYFDAVTPGPYSFSNFTSKIRVKRADLILPRFLTFYLLHLYYSGETVRLQRATTGIRNLDWTAYTELPIPRPPLNEQVRIAAVLFLVKQVLDAESRAQEVLRETKRSVVDRLFAPGRDLVSGWEVERLDECCKVLSSTLSYSDMETLPEKSETGLVPVMGIKVSDMNKRGNEIEIVSANLTKSIPKAEAARRTIPPGSVVFPKRGAAIATNKKRLTTAWTVLDPNLIAVGPGERMDSRFLYHWFQQFDLKDITEPGPTPQLNKKNLVPLPIAHPRSKEEQAMIAGIIDALDSVLLARERKQSALEEVFRTLLAKLMTAEVRATSIDVDTTQVAN